MVVFNRSSVSLSRRQRAVVLAWLDGSFSVSRIFVWSVVGVLLVGGFVGVVSLGLFFVGVLLAGLFELAVFWDGRKPVVWGVDDVVLALAFVAERLQRGSRVLSVGEVGVVEGLLTGQGLSVSQAAGLVRVLPYGPDVVAVRRFMFDGGLRADVLDVLLGREERYSVEGVVVLTSQDVSVVETGSGATINVSSVLPRVECVRLFCRMGDESVTIFRSLLLDSANADVRSLVLAEMALLLENPS